MHFLYMDSSLFTASHFSAILGSDSIWLDHHWMLRLVEILVWILICVTLTTSSSLSFIRYRLPTRWCRKLSWYRIVVGPDEVVSLRLNVVGVHHIGALRLPPCLDNLVASFLIQPASSEFNGLWWYMSHGRGKARYEVWYTNVELYFDLHPPPARVD